MDINFSQVTNDELLFPDFETIANLDCRFNGKEGCFNIGGNIKLDEQYVLFAPIGFGQVFGNLGKHHKDTNFLAIIAYSHGGAFGEQLIRIFFKGIHNGTAQKFASLLATLNSKKIFPFKCLFKAQIKPVRKGEYDVFDLDFTYDASDIAKEFCNKVWQQIPDNSWYNSLPYHKPSDDVILLWKNAIEIENKKPKIIRQYPNGEQIFNEAMTIERNYQLSKIQKIRSEQPKTKLHEIINKYLPNGRENVD